MLDPTGPLPPAVYWRRRAVALSVAVLVLALAGWAVIASVGTEPPRAAVQMLPPPEPGACADATTRVVAEPLKPEFRVGDRIGLRIVTINDGREPCYRDTSRDLRELVVTTPDGKHVWSSNDCYRETTNEAPLLQPGQSVHNDVHWVGLASTPECLPLQQIAPAGPYLLVAKLGDLKSAPVPFRLIS
ncbi:hypothetical protein [Saccharopolyspora taberi]|uniref:Intracellular proteinase inhibitor BsuPI domain-containing protein n=1 Tax=Saccharopolyspora taberi TaxID=60895 RepID=A0ABN3VC76_9PSEU